MSNEELDRRWRLIVDWAALNCPDDLSDEEVSAELKRLGIDMEPAYARLKAMIDEFRRSAKNDGEHGQGTHDEMCQEHGH